MLSGYALNITPLGSSGVGVRIAAMIETATVAQTMVPIGRRPPCRKGAPAFAAAGRSLRQLFELLTHAGAAFSVAVLLDSWPGVFESDDRAGG
jgi:hypothetical protein